jgi:hypothetical protein
LGHTIILGINEQSDAAHFIGDADAPGGGTQEQRSAEATPLNCLIDGEAAETENWHVVAGEAFFDQRRRMQNTPRVRAFVDFVASEIRCFRGIVSGEGSVRLTVCPPTLRTEQTEARGAVQLACQPQRAEIVLK